MTMDKSLKVAGPVLSHTMGWSSQSWCFGHTGMLCDRNCDDRGVKGADGTSDNNSGAGADGNGNDHQQ